MIIQKRRGTSKTARDSRTMAAQAAVKNKFYGQRGFCERESCGQNKKLGDDDEEETNQIHANCSSPTKVLTPARTPVLKLEAITLEDRKDWKLPNFDLLDDNQTEVDSGNIEVNVAIIKKTLADFGIDVEMGEVNVGPTVTQYTLRPAVGVKLSPNCGFAKRFGFGSVRAQHPHGIADSGQSLGGH